MYVWKSLFFLPILFTFYWNIFGLQCCVSFRCTAKWFCYIIIYIYIIHICVYIYIVLLFFSIMGFILPISNDSFAGYRILEWIVLFFFCLFVRFFQYFKDIALLFLSWIISNEKSALLIFVPLYIIYQFSFKCFSLSQILCNLITTYYGILLWGGCVHACTHVHLGSFTFLNVWVYSSYQIWKICTHISLDIFCFSALSPLSFNILMTHLSGHLKLSQRSLLLY